MGTMYDKIVALLNDRGYTAVNNHWGSINSVTITTATGEKADLLRASRCDLFITPYAGRYKELVINSDLIKEANVENIVNAIDNYFKTRKECSAYYNPIIISRFN